MLKTSAYILLVIAAATLVSAAAVAIPWVSADEHKADLQDDLFSAHRTAVLQHRVNAWERLAEAQTLARYTPIAEAVAPPPPEADPLDPDNPDAAPAPRPAASLDTALDKLPLPRRPDFLVVLDSKGLVLANVGTDKAGPAVGEDISGVPIVKDALAGKVRDGLWAHQGGSAVFILGACPIVHIDGQHEKVGGVVLSGVHVDAAYAEHLAELLQPEQRKGYDVEVAFAWGGKVLATSATAPEAAALVNAVVDQETEPSFSSVPRYQGQDQTPSSNQRLGAVVSSYGDGPETARLGVVLVAMRPVLTTDPIRLAAQAASVDLPEDVVTRIGIIFIVGIVLMLFARILIGLEHAGPGRRLLTQLQKLEENIESQEIDLKPFSGVYRDAARSLSTVLLGLRKRLERERALAGGQPVEAASIPPLGLKPLHPTPAALPPSIAPPDPKDEFQDAEATMNVAGVDYAAMVSHTSPQRHEALPSLPDNIANEPDDDALDDRTIESSMLSMPRGGASSIASLLSALPPNVDPASLMQRQTPGVDSTMDMPAEQVAAIMETLQGENPDNPLFKQTREVSPGALESLGINTAAAAFPSSDPDTNEPTRVVTDDELAGEYSEESAVAASARVDDERWARTDQPLTPQSLLGALKKRAAVAPRRGATPMASNEETMVKGVNPSLLRRSFDAPAPPPPVEDAIDEPDFQQLFDDFIATKNQCGEPLDGLTLDRFIKRLQRNKEKLVEQYNCKDVKFQVYVKQGKAALKATPIK